MEDKLNEEQMRVIYMLAASASVPLCVCDELRIITAASAFNSCTKGTRKRILAVVTCILNKCTSYLLAFIHTLTKMFNTQKFQYKIILQADVMQSVIPHTSKSMLTFFIRGNFFIYF